MLCFRTPQSPTVGYWSHSHQHTDAVCCGFQFVAWLFSVGVLIGWSVALLSADWLPHFCADTHCDFLIFILHHQSVYRFSLIRLMVQEFVQMQKMCCRIVAENISKSNAVTTCPSLILPPSNTERQTSTDSLSTRKVNLESPVDLESVSLDCGRKPEQLEETHTGWKQNMQTPHSKEKADQEVWTFCAVKRLR